MFDKYISQLDVVNTCCVYLGCIYWQSRQPTEDFKKKNIFHIFD